MYREAERRGLSCNVGQNFLEALTLYNVRSRGSYQKRCSITSSQIKIAQKHLKELGLYPYKIDGVAGTGTLAAIKKAKEMIGAGASLGECLTATDIKAFISWLLEHVADPKMWVNVLMKWFAKERPFYVVAYAAGTWMR